MSKFAARNVFGWPVTGGRPVAIFQFLYGETRIVEGALSWSFGNISVAPLFQNPCWSSSSLVRTVNSFAYTRYEATMSFAPTVSICQVFLFVFRHARSFPLASLTAKS